MLQTLFEQFINEEGTVRFINGEGEESSKNLNIWFNLRLDTLMTITLLNGVIESIKLTRLYQKGE